MPTAEPFRDPIRHVVVLMLENRSFDQMLGDLQRIDPDVDGVDRAAPRSNVDPGREPLAQSPTARFSQEKGVDFGHEPENVDRQVAWSAPTRMSGFVADFRSGPHGKSNALAKDVMAYFPVGATPKADSLPVLHRLAREFVVCDRWFSSVPGPTWPNRLFAMTGTSAGYRHMPSPAHPFVPLSYGQHTIFDRLADRGQKARVFSAGFASLTTILRRMWLHPGWREGFDTFLELAAGPEANFPAFSWVEPDYFGGDAGDQHPPHDVRLGDRFLGRVYDALRGNEALWTSTLFVVLWDEHGGFYDHCEPQGATPPDDGHDGDFRFDKLGVRVPALLISPWLARGTSHVVFDHTSLLRYVIEKWQLKDLGARAASASSIGSALAWLPAPRADVPAQFRLAVPRAARRALAAGPLNPLQDALLRSIEVQRYELERPGPGKAREVLAAAALPAAARVAKARRALDELETAHRASSELRTVRLLAVHGVGHGDADTAWRDRWRDRVAAQVRAASGSASTHVEVEFATYDDIFERERHRLSAADILKAVLRMTGGMIVGTPGGDRRGLFDALAGFQDRIRWTAGMVVRWVEHEDLRQELRERLADQVRAFDPHVIAAHSLGALITYDLLRREVAEGKGAPHDGRILLTFGAQIAHPAVLPTFDGRIEPVHDDEHGCRHWFHVYNARDRVFTKPLPLSDARTTNLLLDFDVPGDLLNHDGAAYLERPETAPAWERIAALPALRAGKAPPVPASRAKGGKLPLIKVSGVAQPMTAPALARTRASKHRALLVGINDYPNPQMRLEGCVNDTFLVSSVLQESGFDADDIRLLIDERATRAALVSRLEWLVDGVQPGDTRIFFYSGHGAQMPGYGALAEADRVDETLVPYDFDWTRERAFTDDQFRQFYSQLPYGCHLVCVFDCCHAGGMTRGKRTRGIDAPDDVRHRALRWDRDTQMWVPREWVAKRGRTGRLFRRRDKPDAETCGSARYLGQSTAVRSAEAEETRGTRSAYGHSGPYMPLILYACGEQQLASEYEHGSVSYGAFTFVFAKTLRDLGAAVAGTPLRKLIVSAASTLSELGYDQTPELVGPRNKYRKATLGMLNLRQAAPAEPTRKTGAGRAR